MDSEMRAFLEDEEAWGYGPTLDVSIKFDVDIFSAVRRVDRTKVLTCLGMSEPYAGITSICSSQSDVRDWRNVGCCYSIWKLDERAQLGVKVIPSAGGTFDLLLAIPPLHVRRFFGTYPWVQSGKWVTNDVVNLHSMLIGRIREVHRFVPVRTALVMDEASAYPRSLPAGIVIPKDVADAAGYEAASLGKYGDYSCVALE